jgi:hypothetical protein
MKVKKTKSKLPKRKNVEPFVKYDPRDQYDPELDKYKGVDWFPEKTARAIEALKNVKLPNL